MFDKVRWRDCERYQKQIKDDVQAIGDKMRGKIDKSTARWIVGIIATIMLGIGITGWGSYASTKRSQSDKIEATQQKVNDVKNTTTEIKTNQKAMEKKYDQDIKDIKKLLNEIIRKQGEK
jgi:hypothetical protein